MNTVNENQLFKAPDPAESRQISPFLTLTATGLERLKVNDDSEALLTYWFSIAEGELWGNPAWGNPFSSRLFDVMGSSGLVVTEMVAVRKLRQDIPLLKIRGIKAVYLSSDEVSLTIIYKSNNKLTSFTDKVAV